MAKPMTVTKAKDNQILVKFSSDLPGLKRMSAGAEIPPEYLHSILNFHISKQNARGKVDQQHAQRLKAYW